MKDETLPPLDFTNCRCVLILGHSLEHHLHSFLIYNFHTEIVNGLGIPEHLLMKWHRLKEEPFLKLSDTIQTLNCLLPMWRSFMILQLGTNDLFTIYVDETGSEIMDLTPLLFESYGIQLICVRQTIYQRDAPSFNQQVRLLTQYVKVILEPIPYVI